MSKRAIIYRRVSSDDQADYGTSLESQQEKCLEYAADDYFVIADIDDDISGFKRMEHRPGGKMLLDLLARREAEVVIVYSIDRLYRRAGKGMSLIEDWIDDGIELLIVKDRYIVKSASDIKVLIDFWKGEEEREDIRERTMRGHRRMAENGSYIHGGPAPYGYRYEYATNGNRSKPQATYAIYEPEAYTVQKIYNWYVNGIAIAEIVRRLDDTNAPPPQKSGRWGRPTIRFILQNEIYAGFFYYGKTKIVGTRDNKRQVPAPKEDWIRVDAPELQIVDLNIWSAAQKRREKNIRMSKRNRKAKYLLSNFFICGHCNSSISGTSIMRKNGRYRSYRCGCYWDKDKRDDCPNASYALAANIAEEIAWGWFMELFQDDGKLTTALRDYAQRQRDEREPKRRELEKLNHRLDQSDKRIGALVDELYETDNKTVKDAIRTKLDIEGKRKESLEVERDTLQMELSQGEMTPDVEVSILELAAKVRGKLENPTHKQKRELFDRLDFQATFYKYEDERVLKLVCGLHPDGTLIDINSPSPFIWRI